MNVYMDGVFDLFHRGHLEAIKKVRQIAGVDGKVIIGVISDKDTESYKRKTIINEIDRVEIIKKNDVLILREKPLSLKKAFQLMTEMPEDCFDTKRIDGKPQKRVF